MDSRSNEGRIRDNRGTKKRPLDVWEESAMDRDQQSLVGVIRHVQAPRLLDRARRAREAHHMTDQTPDEGGASKSANGSVRRHGWVARHELPVFFTLTFVLSWLFWPFTLLNPDSSPLVPFGPLLAPVAVTALAGGPGQVFALLRQLTRWRVHAIWYVIAVGAPLALIGLAAAITVIAGRRGAVV
jgi:hypothetical protein